MLLVPGDWICIALECSEDTPAGWCYPWLEWSVCTLAEAISRRVALCLSADTLTSPIPFHVISQRSESVSYTEYNALNPSDFVICGCFFVHQQLVVSLPARDFEFGANPPDLGPAGETGFTTSCWTSLKGQSVWKATYQLITSMCKNNKPEMIWRSIEPCKS